MALGEWDLTDVKGCALPQKAQSAFFTATSNIVGVEYEPIAYLGSQVVVGTNYRILALQRYITPNALPRIVRMIIYEDLNGAVKVISISRADI